MNTTDQTENIQSRPMPLLRSIVSLILCPLVVFTPVATFAADATLRDGRLASFELGNKTFQKVSLLINNGELMVTHSGGVYRQRLSEISYKTLQRVGRAKPFLCENREYKEAIGMFVPRVVINAKALTGVRVASATETTATLVTDSGTVACKWSDITPDDREKLDTVSGKIASKAAEVETWRRIALEAQATAARNAAAAREAAAVADRERARQAYREQLEQQAQRAQEKEDKENFGKAAVGAIGLAILYGVAKALGGDDSQSSSSQSARQNDMSTEFANRARREREQENQRAAEQRGREAIARQNRQWTAEAEAAAQRRAQ